MAYNNRHEANVLNEDMVAAFLKDMVARVESSSDSEIETMKKLKKLFKKNVPFSRRSYVAALLIKNATNGYKGNKFRNNDNQKFNRNEKNERFNNSNNRNNSNANNTEERAERAPRVTIDPSVANTIFVSVGKSRGVYPRDLVGLLVGVAGLDRSRIGEIRVLSNYSFIQLFADDCSKVISALNEYEYRGRKLSVSYSKKKEEAEKETVTESKPSETVSASEETIPSNVSNMGHADNYSNSEESKIAAEQSAFAASQTASFSQSAPVDEKPYSSTEDDGQVKSHFGDGAAY